MKISQLTLQAWSFPEQSESQLWIVTAYYPSPEKWMDAL